MASFHLPVLNTNRRTCYKFRARSSTQARAGASRFAPKLAGLHATAIPGVRTLRGALPQLTLPVDGLVGRRTISADQMLCAKPVPFELLR